MKKSIKILSIILIVTTILTSSINQASAKQTKQTQPIKVNNLIYKTILM